MSVWIVCSHRFSFRSRTMNARCSLNAGCDRDAGKETNPMTDNVITAAGALESESPLVLVAQLEPVANLDRFQPAGFPEVGHVIYKAPRDNGAEEQVCIVDSAASMANHLESICQHGAHDLDLVDDLAWMPYLRCVTGTLDTNGKLPIDKREVVVTSLTDRGAPNRVDVLLRESTQEDAEVGQEGRPAHQG
jgi:hypothetical protein